MKYIEKSQLNENIVRLGIKEKNPVFESVKEYFNYTARPNKKDIENYAIKLYINNYTEVDKLYYGENHLMSKCLDRSANVLFNQKMEENKKLLNQAKPAQKGYAYFSLSNGFELKDLFFFVNVEVAKACIDELKFKNKDLDIDIYDENGHSIELYQAEQERE